MCRAIAFSHPSSRSVSSEHSLAAFSYDASAGQVTAFEKLAVVELLMALTTVAEVSLIGRCLYAVARAGNFCLDHPMTVTR